MRRARFKYYLASNYYFGSCLDGRQGIKLTFYEQDRTVRYDGIGLVEVIGTALDFDIFTLARFFPAGMLQVAFNIFITPANIELPDALPSNPRNNNVAWQPYFFGVQPLSNPPYASRVNTRCSV